MIQCQEKIKLPGIDRPKKCPFPVVPGREYCPLHMIMRERQESPFKMGKGSMIPHRGTDPEAIRIAESFGLGYDGIQQVPGGKVAHQFTVYRGPKGSEGITFYVENLKDVGTRLEEKFKQFGIKG